MATRVIHAWTHDAGRETDDVPGNGRIIAWRGWLARVRQSRAYSVIVRPSISSIIGATIGLISVLLLTWVVYTHPTWVEVSIRPDVHTETEMLSFFEVGTLGDSSLEAWMTVFLIGTVLALAIPAFSTVQAIGLLGFLISFNSYADEYSNAYFMRSYSLGAGYFGACLSTIVIFLSCKLTYGPSPESRRPVVLGRVAALSPRATGPDD